MKATVVGLGGGLVALVFLLGACGGDSADDGADDRGSEVDELASEVGDVSGSRAEKYAEEYCDLMEVMDSGLKAQDDLKLLEATEAFEDWADSHENEKVDEYDFKDAVKDECPDFAGSTP